MCTDAYREALTREFANRSVAGADAEGTVVGGGEHPGRVAGDGHVDDERPALVGERPLDRAGQLVG
jgi:hypothetical protein